MFSKLAVTLLACFLSFGIIVEARGISPIEGLFNIAAEKEAECPPDEPYKKKCLETVNKLYSMLLVSVNDEWLSDNRSQIHANIGKNQATIGDLDGAIESFSSAISLDDAWIKENSSLIYYMRSAIYKKQGDKENMLKDYTAAIESNGKWAPGMSAIHFDRAEYYHELKKYDQAISDYLAAINALKQENGGVENARLAEVYDKLGICYALEKKHNKAIEYYTAALGLDSEWTNQHYSILHLKRGTSYFASSDSYAAIRDYSVAIKANDKSVRNSLSYIYQARALVYVTLEENKKAIKDYKNAFGLNDLWIRDPANRAKVLELYLALTDPNKSKPFSDEKNEL